MNKNQLLLSFITITMLSSCSSSLRFASRATFTSIQSNTHTRQQSNTNKIQKNIRFSDEADNSNEINQDSSVSNSTLLKGNASYYGDEFQGRMTTNGEIYLHENFTAAHRTLPFGTFLLVTNLKNNQSVVVRINDRGPFKPNRILDLSYAAAEELDMIRDGVIEVKITVID